MSYKRPFASKVRYAVAVLGEDGKRLPHFPAWEQDTHPFWVREGKLSGALRDCRVLLQDAEAWKRPGGAKERLAALESMSRIAEQGRPTPPIRLPSDAHTVTVQAIGGIPSDGLYWGAWQIQRQETRELTLSIPEDWKPSAELDAWMQEMATQRGVPPLDWTKLLDFALQPWRLDMMWPHASWNYDWEFVRDAEGRRTGKVRPCCVYLRWREMGPYKQDSIELDAFSLALATHWLQDQRAAEGLSEHVICHIVGSNLEYVNAGLVKSHELGGRLR